MYIHSLQHVHTFFTACTYTKYSLYTLFTACTYTKYSLYIHSYSLYIYSLQLVYLNTLFTNCPISYKVYLFYSLYMLNNLYILYKCTSVQLCNFVTSNTLIKLIHQHCSRDQQGLIWLNKHI